MSYAAITGWGIAVPDAIVTSDELERRVGLESGWVEQRSGIVQRRVASQGETTSTLATEAGRRALVRAGLGPDDLDLIVVATCTPDHLVPGTAPMVQAALGASRAGAFDVNAACAGFLTALAAADGLVRAGAIRRALVIGAEVLSRFIDPAEPKTFVLFGDGAGAVVLEGSEEQAGLLSVELGADGSGVEHLKVPAGGSAHPASAETVAAREHTVRMNGPEVYRAAVRIMVGAAEDAIASARCSLADVDLLILHQANQRIITEVGARLGIPEERVFSNVACYGNTSAASVPIALAEAADEGLLEPGSLVALSVVGAGFTWAAGVLRWTAVTSPLEQSILVEEGVLA